MIQTTAAEIYIQSLMIIFCLKTGSNIEEYTGDTEQRVKAAFFHELNHVSRCIPAALELALVLTLWERFV